VHREVVQHYDLPRLQDGNQLLRDEGLEGVAIDGAFDLQPGSQSLDPQTGQQAHTVPASPRHPPHHALATRCAPAQGDHRRGGTSFIQEDEAAGRDGLDALLPRRALLGRLLTGDQGLLLNVMAKRRRAALMVDRLTAVPVAASQVRRCSASVASGRAATGWRKTDSCSSPIR
jgi:hypothetical protein